MTKALNDSDAKILTIDIETRPSLAYIWSLWDTFTPLERLIEQGEMISFAAKWYGKRPVEFASVYHDGKREMINRVWDLVDQADIIVHYNGRKFDYPHLRTEWILDDSDKGAPSPVRQVDLLQTVKTFKFASNKLEHISRQLKLANGTGKLKHTGFQLWVDCMANDPAAWDLMMRYNKHDVVLTEQLYTKLRGWMTSGHPNVGMFKTSTKIAKRSSVMSVVPRATRSVDRSRHSPTCTSSTVATIAVTGSVVRSRSGRQPPAQSALANTA